MDKRSYRFRNTLAFLLAAVMICSIPFTVRAENQPFTQDEIDRLLGVATDASQITSPFIEVVNQVRNSVVGVKNYVTTTSYYGYGFGFGYGYGQWQPETQESLQGSGSGVVITDRGHVLTNYHVVENATRVTVTTGVDDEEHEAKVVGYDADLDIAVLEVSGLNLPAVTLGDSDELQVGEWAIVIGNPIGEKYSRSVTIGAISGLNREVTDQTIDRYGRLTTVTNTMIQTDAAINSGNSGGGMFNILGQLQGIPARYANSASNSMYSSGRNVDNIGLCIPINVAKPLIREVMLSYSGESTQVSASASTENGENSRTNKGLYGRPRLGISISTLSDSISVYGLPQGALIREVEQDSPAQEAGLKAGDIIVEMEGTVISTSDALTAKLAGHQDGDTLQLKIYRDNAFAEQMTQKQADLTNVGNGEYMDISVTIRVIDNTNI